MSPTYPQGPSDRWLPSVEIGSCLAEPTVFRSARRFGFPYATFRNEILHASQSLFAFEHQIALKTNFPRLSYVKETGYLVGYTGTSMLANTMR